MATWPTTGVMWTGVVVLPWGVLAWVAAGRPVPAPAPRLRADAVCDELEAVVAANPKVLDMRLALAHALSTAGATGRRWSTTRPSWTGNPHPGTLATSAGSPT